MLRDAPTTGSVKLRCGDRLDRQRQVWAVNDIDTGGGKQTSAALRGLSCSWV